MEKLTKQDLKSPDVFQSSASRFTELAYKFRAPFVGALSLLLLAGLGWAGYSTFRDHQEGKAQEILFNAQSKLKTTEENFIKATTPQVPLKDPKTGKLLPVVQNNLVKASGNLEADYKDSLPLYKDVIQKYPSSQAAVLASLDLGHLYSQHKKYDEASNVLQGAVKNARHPVTKGLALDQLGGSLEAKGDCSAAISQWEKVEKDKDLQFLHGSSLIKMGLCYEKLNQNDKAEQTYRRAETSTTDAEAARTAKKYLRVLKRS
ncbi:MAG: tetratricopeptide repeat protein [Oligoflexia bacterium]|nr:tetratricopeptide repeat protein [Oligoflexia bacterium]